MLSNPPYLSAPTLSNALFGHWQISLFSHFCWVTIMMQLTGKIFSRLSLLLLENQVWHELLPEHCSCSLTDFRLILPCHSPGILSPLKWTLLHHHHWSPCVSHETSCTEHFCSLLGPRGFSWGRRMAVATWIREEHLNKRAGIKTKEQWSQK